MEKHTPYQHEAGGPAKPRYANAYRDVAVAVTFTLQGGGQSFTGYGYWEGQQQAPHESCQGGDKDVPKIRAAFPAPPNGAPTATWTWTTSCSGGSPTCATDTTPNNTAGLHNRSGTVVVHSSGGNHPLYRHGFLKVNPDLANPSRHLIFTDSPYMAFYWLGDTAWNVPVRATYLQAATVNGGCDSYDWKSYVDARKLRGFTVLQISVPQWGMRNPLRDCYNNPPFLGSGRLRWNPAFWQRLEEKIQYANSVGLVVALVGVRSGRGQLGRLRPALQRLGTAPGAGIPGQHQQSGLPGPEPGGDRCPFPRRPRPNRARPHSSSSHARPARLHAC